jgi:TolA-binding protein
MQVAKDLYQASRFGLAIAELAQISKKFGPKVGDGEVKYYLGRSYLGMKEYLNARTELEAFIKDFPGNSNVGMAKLDLAKAYTGLNLRERARKELAGVAKDYEGREEGDIAANELKSLRGAL